MRFYLVVILFSTEQTHTQVISLLIAIKLPIPGNLDNLKGLKLKNYTHINIDICDFSSLRSLFYDFKPDSLIHFAESHVDRSIHSPLDFVNTNVNGTVNLLNETMFYLKV